MENIGDIYYIIIKVGFHLLLFGYRNGNGKTLKYMKICTINDEIRAHSLITQSRSNNTKWALI